MNTRLNKKVKKDLDAYFKGFRGSDPEVHHGLKHILIGALTDANFHSEAKQVQNMFPKAKQSKYYGRTALEDSIEQNHGEPIAKAAKWDGYEIIDAISFFASMFIGGPVGAKITSLKEGMNENVKMFVSRFIKEVTHSHEYEDMSSMGADENDKEERVSEAKSMDTSKRLKVYDKLKKGDEITIKYGSSMSSGREGKFKVTKGKTLVGKQKVERIILQNVANPTGVKFYLYQRNGNVTMAIGNLAATIEDMHESVNEGLNHNDMYTMLDIAAGYSSTQDQAASQMWYDEQDLYDYLKSDHIPKKYHKKFYKDIQRRFKGVKESVSEGKDDFMARHGKADINLKKGYKHHSEDELTKLYDKVGKLAKDKKIKKVDVIFEAKEPEVITQLRKIVKDSQNDLIKDTKSGKKVRVDMNSANLIVQVYDALKKQSNKDKFVKSGIVMMGHTAYKLMKKENTSEVIEEAEYQGRKVELNKPMQGDSKKFKVYVKNEKGNVVVVHFGQKGMVIKKDNPAARKSFRARMNCDNPGPKWKANYWSCRKW